MPENKTISKIRIQKVLSNAGVLSRQKCERYIDEKRITLNGSTITEKGVKIDPNNDIITVDNKKIYLKPKHVSYAFNKPKGVLSTMEDNFGRKTISHFLGSNPEGLYYSGRLDLDTSGLIILTNDGDLSQKICHPSNGIQKTYIAKVKGFLTDTKKNSLLTGIIIDGVKCKFDHIQILDSFKTESLLKIKIHIGKKHIVRKMLKCVELPVQELIRTQIAGIKLGSLKKGEIRKLTKNEIESIL